MDIFCNLKDTSRGVARGVGGEREGTEKSEGGDMKSEWTSDLC